MRKVTTRVRVRVRVEREGMGAQGHVRALLESGRLSCRWAPELGNLSLFTYFAYAYNKESSPRLIKNLKLSIITGKH